MGLYVQAAVAHTVRGQTEPVITSMGNVIKVVTLDTMETHVPGPAAVTVLGLTTPVTVPVEPVRKAVMPGIMEANVVNVAAGNCAGNKACGRDSGACHSCNPGQYGNTCHARCSRHCAGPHNACHRTSGACEAGCKPGYTGPKCTQRK